MLKFLQAIAIALAVGSVPFSAHAQNAPAPADNPILFNDTADQDANTAPLESLPEADQSAENPPLIEPSSDAAAPADAKRLPPPSNLDDDAVDDADVSEASEATSEEGAASSEKSTDETNDSADCDCSESSDCCDSCGCGDTCSCDSSLCCSWLEGYTISKCMGIRDCSSWEIGGWTEAGYTNNNVPLSQAYNDLLSFNDVPDHLHLNQQWFYIGKNADGSCGMDWGGRMDLVYGTDAQKTQAFGNPDAGVRNEGTFDASWDNGEYGWAMPQLYAEVAMGDTTAKIGHFFTPLGYEVIPATGNFFYTHSYTFFNSEPFTHTGVLATNESIDGLKLYAGWTLGWDTGFDQLNSGNSGIAGFTKDLGESTTFTYIATFGNFGWRDGGSGDSYQHSAVLDMKLSSDFEWVLQSDSVQTDNEGVSEYDTVGAVSYLFYTLSDKYKLGNRTEWWKADGVSFYEATFGVNINAAENFVFRPEWRQDWAPGIGLDEDAFAIDAIWSY